MPNVTRKSSKRLNGALAQWLRLIPAAAGLHLAADLISGTSVDITHVVRRAEERGVRVSSLSDYDDGTAVQSGLVIGYGAIATARIDEGMKRLAASFGVRIRS